MTTSGFADTSVLVIEDESFTRMVLARILGTLGFKAVHQAHDGESGLHAVREHRPDIVVCDVEMMPVNGLAFLRTLRDSDDPRLLHLPVVFMTNRLDPSVVDDATRLGAGTFIAKPATPESLRRALGEHLACRA
jgi:two-component system chemotaxis response regulator CheY